jgi:hypothetical protein
MKLLPNPISLPKLYLCLVAIVLSSIIPMSARADCMASNSNWCMGERNLEQGRQAAEANNRMAADLAMQAQADGSAAAAPPPRATQRLFTVGAVVWYTSTEGVPGVYVAAGEYNETDARAAALSNCYHAGGSDCRVGFILNRGFVAVAAADDGSKFAGHADNKGAARSRANQLCRQANKSCNIRGIYDSTGTDFYVP